MLHWITVESREAHVPKEWLLHMSFREAEVCSSAFLVTVLFSSKHLPQICAWLGRSSHSSISSLLTPFPPAQLLPPLFQPSLKCLTWSSYMTSYSAPPMMCYFCQFLFFFYLLSAAIFSQGKSSL